MFFKYEREELQVMNKQQREQTYTRICNANEPPDFPFSAQAFITFTRSLLAHLRYDGKTDVPLEEVLTPKQYETYLEHKRLFEQMEQTKSLKKRHKIFLRIVELFDEFEQLYQKEGERPGSIHSRSRTD